MGAEYRTNNHKIPAEMETVPSQDIPSDSSNLLEDCKPHEQHRISGTLCCKPFSGMTVGPVLFLTMFGANMSGILLTNLLLVKSCEYMGFSHENCSHMDTESGTPAEKIVQPYVAKLNMYKLIFESVVPTVTAFFIGPWSDKYGRRPLMIAPLIGYCLNFILLLGFTWFNLAPPYIILTSAPLVFLGGSMVFFTGSFCYVNDTSTKQDLPYRIGVAEGMLYLGFVCGNTAAPYIFPMFPSHGYEAIFCLSLFICFVSLLYVTFILPESVQIDEHNLMNRFKALLNFQQVTDLFKVCFGSYEGFSRPIRLMLVVVSLLSLIALEGTLAVFFLFVRKKYLWDVKEFSVFTDISLLLNIGGITFGTVAFSKWLKVPLAPLLCFSFVVKGVGYLIYGLGENSWCLYLGSAVGGLGGMTTPLLRAIISETVPKKDIGKLFSILSAFSTSVPIVAGIIYTTMYSVTLNSFPGAIFLFSAALTAVCSILMGVVAIKRPSNHPDTDHQILNEENDIND